MWDIYAFRLFIKLSMTYPPGGWWRSATRVAGQPQAVGWPRSVGPSRLGGTAQPLSVGGGWLGR